MVATSSYPRHDPPHALGFRVSAITAPAALSAVTILLLAFWILADPSESAHPSKTGTVLGLTSAALSLIASSYKIQTRKLRAASIAFGFITAGTGVIGSLPTLLVNSTTWLVELGRPITVPANVGLAFIIFGVGTIAALLTTHSITRRYVPGISGAATSTLGLVALVGYVTGLPYTYEWAQGAPMSIAASVAITLLGFGTISVALRWDGRTRRRSYTSLALGVLIAGLTASGITGSALHGAQVKSEQQVITILANNVARYLNRALRTDLRPLETMAAQWREVGQIPEREWQAQANLMLDRMPGLRAVLWIDKDIVGRRVAPINLPGEWIGRRYDVPLLIEYGKRVMSGSEPSLYPVFDGARGRSFSMMMPVYDGAEQDGLLLTVIDTALWGESVLEEVAGFSSIIITDSVGVVYDNEVKPLPNGLQASLTIKVGEEEWLITATETQGLLNGTSSILPQVAVTLGLILTLLLYSSVLIAQTSLKRSKALAKANAQLEAEVSARQRVQNELEKEVATRRKTQAVLTTDRERLDLALGAGGTGTWRLDPETGQLEVDQQSINLFGFTPQTFQGTYESFKKVVLPEDLPRIERAVDKALNSHEDFEEDFRILKPDGAVHVIYGRARVIQIPNTEKVMMIGINQDVTERRRTEKLSTLGTLAAGFAHELNNPLMGCVNYVAYAHRKTENARAREALGKAETEIKRVIRVVQNMLSFSRFKEDLSAQANITDAIKSAVSLTNSSHHGCGITLANNVKDSLPCAAISADALEQILLNLLINAGHAVETSEIKTISIDADQDSDNIFISVSDSGCGISKDVARRLFEPFFTTKKAGKGSGLGLSISLDMIKRFGGGLEFDSTLGVGTTFVITVPKLKTYEDPHPPKIESASP